MSQQSSVGVRWEGVGVELGGQQIVDDIDLEVAGGSWVSLIGPNGAGKTTLVRALAGTVHHRGTVSVDGRDSASLSVRERARLVAFVPQHPLIPPGVRTFDYVLLGRAPHQGLRFAPSIQDRRRVYAVLQRLDLDDFAQRRVDTLSGGECQRVVLARALAQDTPVLVLDEPTAYLDVGHQLEVLELVGDLRSEGALTVVTTLHDLSVAGQFADVLAVISDGRLIVTDTPERVLTPAVINEYWGVNATTSVDEHGAVTVTVHRRREDRERVIAEEQPR